MFERRTQRYASMRRFRKAPRRRSTRRSPPPTGPFPPQAMQQRLQGEGVALPPPAAADPPDDHVFDVGDFPESLPARGVGEVDLDGGQAGIDQRVPHGDARVGVRRGIDHDPVEPPLRPLEPLDDLPFVVRLEEGDLRPFPPGRLRHRPADVRRSFTPVDGRLTIPENVQVGTVHEEDPERRLLPHSISLVRRAAWRRRNLHFPGTVPRSVTITRKYSSAALRMNTCARSPPRWSSSAAPSPFSTAMRSHSWTVSPSTPASAPDVTP